jgi:S-methylmethionine-dependent homocysteine/selenocysteine methylase
VPFHPGAARQAPDGRRLAAQAGTLARKVADGAGRPVRVAGSLPPVCGSYRADLFDARVARPLLEVLVEALRPSIDHWQGETLSAIEEAALIRAVIGNDGKPLWLSFTVADGAGVGATPCVRSGEPVAAAVRAALDLGAEAVLFNCSQPEVMGAAVSAAVAIAAGSMPIGVYANAFPPQRADADANGDILDIRADLTPTGYLGWARDWVARGASIVGGCCGIGPEHIAALRAAF